MKEIKVKRTGWDDSDLAKAHRAKSIRILLNNDEDLWHYLFHHNPPIRLREEKELFGQSFKLLSSEEGVLVRASLDLWNSTGDLYLWEFLWDLDYLSFIRLIRAMCHLRELQLETIQGIMSDYLGPIS